MNKFLRYPIRIFLAILVIIIIAAIVCLKPLDATPYQQCDFYKKEMDTIAAIANSQSTIINHTSEILEVGWSRVNLLPPFTTPIAIDDHRGGRHFEGVHDSVYVRAFVFRQGGKKIAYISADLLIIPPTVTCIFDTLLSKEGFDTKNIYFTATHTHTSIGAWHDSYVGVRFAGKFDPLVPPHIAHCIAEAIIAAEKNCSPAKVGYAEVPTTKLVFNRLVKEKGKVDSLLRIVKIEKANGGKAAIITFSAHCTVFHEGMMQISGDWAGIMMDKLNISGKVDFACFSAGAVGSHGPYEVTKDQEKESQYMASHVADIVLAGFDSIPVSDMSGIIMQHIPLYLRSPDMRVTSQIVIRPWLFKKLFGDEKVYMNTFQIGDIYFVGTPCDFSGELDYALDSTAQQHHLHLLITSFNGGYMGYVTDTKWYEMDTYETRIMGWFGPGNGDYFSEVIRKLMAKNINMN
jgi:neutral ceramidase